MKQDASLDHLKRRSSVRQKADLIIHPIKELATPHLKGVAAHGLAMADIKRVPDAAVAIKDGLIIEAGTAEDVFRLVEPDAKTRHIDATGRLVTPGLVDPHTHLIFGGNRANEFIMRCQGKSYGEIAAQGGGIVASMQSTRQSSTDDLVATGLARLARMLAHGTTICEVKTGYGLTLESEMTMLKSIYRLKAEQPIELVPTFMPAHAIPPACDRQSYVHEIVDRMLPAAAEYCLSNNLPFPFVDVFCDKGYFTLADTRLIFKEAARLGFKTKVHADEFANLGATRLAVEQSSTSSDHLLHISAPEIELLAKSGTIAVLLPGTSFFLNLKEHAPARAMIDEGVAVALGSDFNPGSCHIFSLPLIWGLACLNLKMTPEEALTALTLNAAYALGLGERVGQLIRGYQADITIYDVGSLEEVPYNLGWNPVSMVIKRGELVSPRET